MMIFVVQAIGLSQEPVMAAFGDLGAAINYANGVVRHYFGKEAGTHSRWEDGFGIVRAISSDSLDTCDEHHPDLEAYTNAAHTPAAQFDNFLHCRITQLEVR